MNLDEVEETLEEYGLSPYQANAFLTILELRDASVSEINEACNVPQPRIYDVLEALDEKGIIETYENESLRARIYDPTDFVTRLERKADDFYGAAEKIEEYWEKPPYEKHSFEIYDDFQQIIDHSIEDIRRAEGSINLAVSGSEFLRVQSALEEAARDDAIVNLSIHLDDMSETEIGDLEPYLRDTVSEARYRKTSAPFLALIDSHKSYFGVPRPRSGYGMFVQDQALSTMLYRYFQDSLWKRWEPIYEGSTGEFPKEFASIRTCVSELAPHVNDGVSFWASVDGYETETGRERQLEGEVIGVVPDPDVEERVEAADRVSLQIQSESEIHTVGGFGAIMEDIRATRIRIR